MPSSRPIPLVSHRIYEHSATATPPHFFQFLKLPIELICHTLTFLGMHDLLACKQSCKSLDDLISKTPRLQFTIDLAEYQMVAAPSPPGMSIAAQRRLLNEREERWRNLQWRSKHSTVMPAAGSIYEFVGGIYANGHGTGDDRRVAGSITFYQLPSTNDGSDRIESVPSWTLSGFDMNIIDFSMDPAQDLLVLVASAPPGSKYTYQVHLRTLSTNEPHPKALSPVLDCRRYSGPEPADMWTSFRIQILDNFLAILIKDVFHTSAAFIAIWNWQAGSKAKCKMALAMGVDDLCFLSRSEFMIVIPRGYLDVYTFQDPAVEKVYPVLRRRFGLPRLQPGFYYWYTSATANPTPGVLIRKPSSPSPSRFASASPFLSRPDDGLIACSLGTLNPSSNAGVECYVFFMRIRTLLDAAAVERETTLVPWESWGPRATRWFGDMLSSDWQHAVHGFRTVERVMDESDIVGDGFEFEGQEAQGEEAPGEEASGEVIVEEGADEDEEGEVGPVLSMRKVRVKDFNPYVVAREKLREGNKIVADHDERMNEESGGGRLVTVPSIIPAGAAFKQDVVSCLPYREVVTDEPVEVSDVMLDDNRILCLKRNSSGQLSAVDVLTF